MSYILISVHLLNIFRQMVSLLRVSLILFTIPDFKVGGGAAPRSPTPMNGPKSLYSGITTGGTSPT